jgi:dihydroneopterin aldolase
MEKWIRLTGLRLNVAIGIHAFEQAGPQPYQLDVGLRLVNNYRTLHDQIDETVDYDQLRTRLVNYLVSRHFNLQETVIQDAIGICFSIDARVVEVDVRTAKTSVYPDCDAVGLHYRLTRDEWARTLATDGASQDLN